MKQFFCVASIIFFPVSSFAFDSLVPMAEQAAIDAVNSAAHTEGSAFKKAMEPLLNYSESDELGGTKALTLSFPEISKAEAQYQVFVRKPFSPNDGSGCPVTISAEVLVTIEFNGDDEDIQKSAHVTAKEVLPSPITLHASCGGI